MEAHNRHQTSFLSNRLSVVIEHGGKSMTYVTFSVCFWSFLKKALKNSEWIQLLVAVYLTINSLWSWKFLFLASFCIFYVLHFFSLALFSTSSFFSIFFLFSSVFFAFLIHLLYFLFLTLIPSFSPLLQSLYFYFLFLIFYLLFLFSFSSFLLISSLSSILFNSIPIMLHFTCELSFTIFLTCFFHNLLFFICFYLFFFIIYDFYFCWFKVSLPFKLWLNGWLCQQILDCIANTSKDHKNVFKHQKRNLKKIFCIGIRIKRTLSLRVHITFQY